MSTESKSVDTTPTIHVGFIGTHGDILPIGHCAQMEDDVEPTHWRPLPAPPVPAANTKEGRQP